MVAPRPSASERALAAKRALRDAARIKFGASLAEVKADAAPAKLAARVRQELTYRARDVAVQAIEVASDNRGVIAGAATLLALWFARRPVAAGAVKLWNKGSERVISALRARKSA